MKKDKLMLVLKIGQGLGNNTDVGTTTFKKIPYVLHCCGIDLGIKFKTSINGPYSKEFNFIYSKWEDEGLIEVDRYEERHYVTVTDKFDVSKYKYSKNEVKIVQEVYKTFLKFNHIIDAELFDLLLEYRLGDSIDMKKESRYYNKHFTSDRERMNKIIDEFMDGVAPYLEPTALLCARGLVKC